MRIVWLVAAVGCVGSTDTDEVMLDGNNDDDVTDGVTDNRQSPTANTGDSGGTKTQDCSVGPSPTGPWSGHPLSEASVTTTTKAPTADAGLAAVRAAAEKAGMDSAKVSLPVSGALVTAKGFVPSNGTFAKFWVADSSGPHVVFNVDLPDAPGLQPGDVVDFTATEVGTFFGLPQITELTDFTVTSTGEDVQVIDANTTTLDYDTHGERVVEAWGELVTDNGPCGGDATCYDMTVGTQTLVFRTESNYVQVGDCIHFIGPLQRFQETLQLTVEDFDWFTDY